MNGRRAAKDTSIPLGGGPDGQSPVFIGKGTEVGYSVHIMHRRKDLWGEDAEEFKPARWSGRRVGWEYLPFNGGPRICLGQQFALTELSYVIVRMLQRFDEIDGSQVVEREKLHGLTLTNCPGNGVPIRMRKAA
ncbi:hypothetical protein LTS18_015124 [Coniosporium uncinatum]|uniref:Uncharacterized protein n=1 Tax=Coniosporium uncinatum TaxID=93489 RepID=A0ACC3CUF8_9PEZI|nr:hypothetical protein LTS18_015124 [Coniosporium uncinatum]